MNKIIMRKNIADLKKAKGGNGKISTSENQDSEADLLSNNQDNNASSNGMSIDDILNGDRSADEKQTLLNKMLDEQEERQNNSSVAKSDSNAISSDSNASSNLPQSQAKKLIEELNKVRQEFNRQPTNLQMEINKYIAEVGKAPRTVKDLSAIIAAIHKASPDKHINQFDKSTEEKQSAKHRGLEVTQKGSPDTYANDQYNSLIDLISHGENEKSFSQQYQDNSAEVEKRLLIQVFGDQRTDYMEKIKLIKPIIEPLMNGLSDLEYNDTVNIVNQAIIHPEHREALATELLSMRDQQNKGIEPQKIKFFSYDDIIHNQKHQENKKERKSHEERRIERNERNQQSPNYVNTDKSNNLSKDKEIELLNLRSDINHFIYDKKNAKKPSETTKDIVESTISNELKSELINKLVYQITKSDLQDEVKDEMINDIALAIMSSTRSYKEKSEMINNLVSQIKNSNLIKDEAKNKMINDIALAIMSSELSDKEKDNIIKAVAAQSEKQANQDGQEERKSIAYRTPERRNADNQKNNSTLYKNDSINQGYTGSISTAAQANGKQVDTEKQNNVVVKESNSIANRMVGAVGNFLKSCLKVPQKAFNESRQI